MSKNLQEQKCQDLECLLDGVKLEVNKKSNKTGNGKTKILTFNQGYIQYVNKDELIARQTQQSKSKLSIEEYTLKHGYFLYKAGTNITLITNNEHQIEFGWTNNENKEYQFNFRFKIKYKIIYNPAPQKQQELKQKKKKNPQKDIIWRFDVELQSEIKKIEDGLVKIEERKQRLLKHQNCDKFIEKFDQMDIEIQNSESLENELQKCEIEFEFLGYISKKLKNNTNRNIVNADIVARSLNLYLSNLNEYKLNKLAIINNLLITLYTGQARDFQIDVIKIAQQYFESNLEDSDFIIIDVLLLNAMMYHLKFSIDLDVNKLVNFGGFFTSIDFSSLIDLSNQNQLAISNYNNVMKQMNYYNFLKFQEVEKIENYCRELFGEENQYIGVYYLQYYKKSQDIKNKPYLELAKTIFEKHLNNSHRLHNEALQLLNPENNQDTTQKHDNENQNNENQNNENQNNENQNNENQNSKNQNNENQNNENQNNENQEQLQIILFSEQKSTPNVEKEQQLKQQNQQKVQQIFIQSQQQNQNENSKINVTKQVDTKLQLQIKQDSELRLISFKSSQTKSTHLSLPQSSDEKSYKMAEQSYEKQQIVGALAAIDQIQNKTKKVVRLGFLIERKLKVPSNFYYSDCLFKYYIIYGCGVKDFQDIREILELQFKYYIDEAKITFTTQRWKNILNQLKTRQFTTEEIIIVNDIIETFRQYRYDDMKNYFKSLIINLTPERQAQNYQYESLNVYLDQFQLVSKLYFQSNQNN